MKTIERAHQPAKMWEKVQLSNNYQTALKQVTQAWWFLIIELGQYMYMYNYYAKGILRSRCAQS